jgi:hypothetical protein
VPAAHEQGAEQDGDGRRELGMAGVVSSRRARASAPVEAPRTKNGISTIA